MAKFLKDVLKGNTHTVTKKATDLGGYAPKAGDEQKFAKIHSVDVTTVNGTEDQYKGGTKKASFKKALEGGVTEAKETDTPKCNNTASGVACPVHGIKECSTGTMKEEELDEISAKTLTSYRDKVLNSPSNAGTSKAYTRDVKGVGLAGDKLNPQRAALKGNKVKVPATEETIDELSKTTLGGYVQGAARDLASRQYKLGTGDKSDTGKIMNRRKGIDKAADKLAKEETIDEVITKKTPAGEVIKDFEKSDNPKFAGKSKEKRKQMALAAFYAKQRNEELEIVDEAMSPKQKAHSHRVKTSPGPKGFTHDPSSNFEAPVHKVEVSASKEGNHHTIMHHIRSKDKHSAVFDAQLHFHKRGYKIHNAVHKGLVKESDTPITFPNRTSDNALGQNI
jgi:hypothetical protein